MPEEHLGRVVVTDHQHLLDGALQWGGRDRSDLRRTPWGPGGGQPGDAYAFLAQRRRECCGSVASRILGPRTRRPAGDSALVHPQGRDRRDLVAVRVGPLGVPGRPGEQPGVVAEPDGLGPALGQGGGGALGQLGHGRSAREGAGHRLRGQVGVAAADQDDLARPRTDHRRTEDVVRPERGQRGRTGDQLQGRGGDPRPLGLVPEQGRPAPDVDHRGRVAAEGVFHPGPVHPGADLGRVRRPSGGRRHQDRRRRTRARRVCADGGGVRRFRPGGRRRRRWAVGAVLPAWVVGIG